MICEAHLKTIVKHTHMPTRPFYGSNSNGDAVDELKVMVVTQF